VEVTRSIVRRERTGPLSTRSTSLRDCFFFGLLRARSFAPLKAMSRFLGCFFFAIRTSP